MTSEAKADRGVRLAACLERARLGEAGALDTIVRELNPLLWHVVRSQGVSAHEAADVVQTVWLELVRRLDEIRSPSALTAWLVSVAKHESWNSQRRGRRTQPTDDLGERVDEEPAAVDRLIEGERARCLWRSFRRLDERCQGLLRVVVMVERPDYEAVSEALGMPHGSIGPTRGRCLQKLRTLLQGDPEWSAT